MKTIHLDCQCYSLEHVIRFDLDEEEKELWASTYLCNWLPWYKRIWLALKYVLRFEPRHGHFDTWILKPEDASRLRTLLDEFDSITKADTTNHPQEDQRAAPNAR